MSNAPIPAYLRDLAPQDTVTAQVKLAQQQMVYPSARSNQVNRTTWSILNVPRASIYKASGAQTIATATWTAVTMTTVSFDSDNMTGTASAITARTTGLYDCIGLVPWAANNTGARGARFVVDGSAVYAVVIQTVAATYGVDVQIAKTLQLAAGQVLTLEAFQASGGNLNTNPGFGGPCLDAILVSTVG